MRTACLLQREVDLVLWMLTPANRLIMRVALHTGLRISDVLELRPEQLKRNFWVTEQKTGKKRQVGLPDELLEDLRGAAGEYWVFPSPRNKHQHRTRQGVWKDVKRAARAARLPANIGTHSARKTYAVDLLRQYGDIERVRRALNHGSIEVTLIYAMADQRRNAGRRGKAGRKKA